MELAYNELLTTINEAKQYKDNGGKHPSHLKIHVDALTEDIDMLGTFETNDDDLRARATQLIYAARRAKRNLERDIIDIQIEEAPTPPPLNAQQPPSKSSALKLTPLQLPIFDGQVSNFHIYRNFFEENILHSKDLTDTAKWLRLKETLKGHPAELISEIPQSGQTLLVAWKLLLEIYGGEDRPVVDLYTKLQQLPPATLHTDKLRLTHSKLEGLLMSLEHLGHDVETNHFVRYTYLGKFPVDIMYHAQKRKDTPLKELRTTIGEIIAARECTDQQRGNPSSRPPRPFDRAANNSNTTSEPSNRGTTSKKPSSFPKPLKCVFCEAEHWNDACTVYATIETRKQKLAGRCFRCLRFAHPNAQCLTERRCFHCDNPDHNRALCPIKFANAALQTTQLAVIPPASNATSGPFLTFMASAISNQITSPMRLRVLLDTGGGATVATQRVADQLHLRSSDEIDQYTGLNEILLTQGKRLVDDIILLADDGVTIPVQAALINGTIPDVPTPNIERFRVENPSLNDICIPPTGEGQPVDLLIGGDMLVDILRPEKIKAINADTLLLPTKFGFLIVGRQRQRQRQVCHSIVLTLLTNPLQQLSDLDLVGLTGLDQAELDDEEAAIRQFYETVRFIADRYFISWPWRNYPPLLEPNFGLALGRLRSLYKRLQKSPELLTEYHNIILKQLCDGIVEKVSAKASSSPVVHYLPHHPVLQPEKSTTVRPVYDGSSRSTKMQRSLNDNIRKGTKWLNDLLSTLLRFRRYKTVMISDIARAFHQIGINESDRDAARFLWLKDPTQPPTDTNLQIYRFMRVAFGIIASPFLLYAVIRHHANQQPQTQFLSIILRDLYADNLVTTLPSSINPQEFYNYAKSFFSSMSMNLTKWATDVVPNPDYIPKDDQLPELVQSILGIRWNRTTDKLAIKPPHIRMELVPTPRTVARDMALRFDPLGWAAPITLLPKLFFRKIWDETKNWDTKLSQDRAIEWHDIAQKLKQIDNIRLPRCLTTFETATAKELHVFVDASAVAYAVVVYLRLVSPNSTEITLLAAKSRLTPKKTVTIPKLELIAILLGCKFAQYIREALNLEIHDKTFLWSDSRCALSWMKQNKILPPILEKYITEAKKFHITEMIYVPSEMNYADPATRGTDFQSLSSINWWRGPDWLIDELNWPKNSQATEQNPSLITNLQYTVTCKKQILLETDIQGVATLNIQNFSSLETLLRRTAFCFKALTKFRKTNFLDLQTDVDTSIALQWWLYWDQNRYYALHTEPEAGQKFFLRNIAVFRDHAGLIRCQTRITNSVADLNTVNPILLVKKSTLTKLIILQEHEKCMHAGTSHTLANVRKNFWLPQGRREVYSTLYAHCFKCTRHLTEAYPTPPSAPLPEFRVNRTTKPFENVGLDICGPFYTRTILGKGQPKIKRWVILFTCAVIRAVHLELLQNMTTPEILLAFRRFFARRGVPKQIISDNAPQFHVLDGCFKNIWHDLHQSETISAYFAKQKIVWNFVPELSPWMGGMYERLVRSIKIALEKTYGDIILLDRQFETTMIEIENVINSRPISYVDREPDSPIVTPNDFLMAQYASIPIQDQLRPDDDLLKKLWRSSQTYLNAFWNHWSNHYLLLLRERNDELKNARRTTNAIPSKGDIVVMIDPSKKRSAWQIAVIERLISGHDKQIRAAQIRIPNGSRLIRPIIALAPLKLSMELPNVRDEQLNAERNAIIHSLPEDAALSDQRNNTENTESDSGEESEEKEASQEEES